MRTIFEHNMRTIFLQKSSQNVMDKLFPDLFLRNQKIEYISGPIVLGVLYNLFLFYAKLSTIEIY